MKLLSQISRKYGDTKYTKFWIVIPQKIMEQLGWKKGQELKAKAENDKLIIEKE